VEPPWNTSQTIPKKKISSCHTEMNTLTLPVAYKNKLRHTSGTPYNKNTLPCQRCKKNGSNGRSLVFYSKHEGIIS